VISLIGFHSSTSSSSPTLPSSNPMRKSKLTLVQAVTLPISS
jgi:hypothetical protein